MPPSPSPAAAATSSSSSGLGAVSRPTCRPTRPSRSPIDTDLEGDQYKSLDAILNRFPGADTIKALLKAQLSMGQEGVDFDKDIKPLLGNPAVISATDVTLVPVRLGGVRLRGRARR